MVKDFKGYWEKADRKPRSSGWFILVISHMAIFIVGLSLGHWMGERFADLSSPQKTPSRQVESEKGKVSESAAGSEKRSPQEAFNKDAIKKMPVPSEDRPKKEPQFTFYESLQKENIPGVESPIKTRETKKTDTSKEAGLATSGIGKQQEFKNRKSTSRIYYVQVSSFREEARARDLAERLRGRGFPAEVVSKVLINRGIWYRVRMGPFGNKTEANKKAAAVKKSEKVQPFILTEKREESP